MEYVVVKWLHVLASTFLFGTGVGSAWYLLFASRSGDARAAAVVARQVVIADLVFTATTAVFQPLSGAWLVHRAGFDWSGRWLLWSIALYALAIACWLPVIWLQLRLRDLATAAVRAGAGLPPGYFHYLRIWVALGIPAFCAFVAIFYLMVAKPV